MPSMRARRLVKFRNEDRFAYVEQRKPSGAAESGGGVKWSSCNQSVSQVDFTPIFAVGGGKSGWSPVMWLFLLPGLATIGIAIGVSTPAGAGGLGIAATMSAIEAAIASLGLTLASLAGIRSLALLNQIGNAIAAFLPAGSRVQFVEYTKPCNEEDYEGD